MQLPGASIGRAWFLGQLGLLAAAYFVAGKLSLLLAIPPGYATALWPPSGIATLERARRRAEGLRLAIKHLDLKAGERAIGTLTASLGVMLYPDHATSADALISASDNLLYEAKNSGRDRVVIGMARAGVSEAPPQAAAGQP